MAQLVYRGNLSAKVFPFTAEFFGRSIIVSGQDQNFSRQVGSNEDPDKDKGIPQIYYCHNVMPSAYGFQSIGFIDELFDTKTALTNIFNLRAADGSEVFFSHASDGLNYVLPIGGNFWRQINTIVGTAGKLTTTATINGQTYVYFSEVGCYMYDTATLSLIPIVLTGLDVTKVLGITSSAGYLIAWTATAIAWSSTVARPVPTDPIDFVPSLVTGAGGGNVEMAKGIITLCAAHYLGFIVYTTSNAVASVYSGNARYPFNLREIVSAGGLADPALLSFDASAGNHYAYTTSGLQSISVSATQTILSDVTDFLAGKYFEDFNETTLQFERTALTASMKKSIQVISDRYLVISYGKTELTHALIYDQVQKRFGKVRVTHVRAFEFKILTPEVIETPRESIGFLQANGSIKVIDFSFASGASSGVMLVGKFQYVRSRTLQLDQVDVETIKDGAEFQCYDLASIDGKNFLPPVAGYLTNSLGGIRSYKFRTSGLNHTLLFKGAFFLDSMVLAFNIAGRR